MAYPEIPSCEGISVFQSHKLQCEPAVNIHFTANHESALVTGEINGEAGDFLGHGESGYGLTGEATLMIEPPPVSIMPGRKARMVRHIPLTLISKDLSQTSSLQSRRVPQWMKPVRLKEISTGPMGAAVVSTVPASRTSNVLLLIGGRLSANAVSDISVAWTVSRHRQRLLRLPRQCLAPQPSETRSFR